MKYPFAKQNEQTDDYHGIPVSDPYRWLEDSDSEDTRAWIAAENRLTEDFLSHIPARAGIQKRLSELWDFERYGIPFTGGSGAEKQYFYFKNSGLQNQNVLYTMPTLDAEPRILLDPNELSADGTAALSAYAVSPDGKYIAYGISQSGSDWVEWKVRIVETGNDLPDLIQWTKFSDCSWTKDVQGFFYSRYDQPSEGEFEATNYFQKLYYHKLGTNQSEDTLVYERSDKKEWRFDGQVSRDGQHLIITVRLGTGRHNCVFYKDLSIENSSIVELISEFDDGYSFIGNKGSVLYFETDKNASRGRIIAYNVAEGGSMDNAKEIVAETPEALSSATLVGGYLLLSYLKDAHTCVRQHAITGELVHDVTLPGIGTVVGFDGDVNDPETFYSFTSFTTPPCIFKYNTDSKESTVFLQPKTNFEASDYTTEQIFYTSKDGTKVPMCITYKKGMQKNGENLTVLYGYGGFGIALTPAFSVSNIVWMEMGGIFAQPNLRGGSEYGEEWHLAGTKLQKQNVFDDFIAAAEWLIEHKYTSSPKLAIFGGSNGGLLVGACMIQRPELFGAVLPAVGVMDMLRFSKFTIGWAWVSDYGSIENEDEFRALYAYSPLHNLKPGTHYPPVLITTADHDDRVVPAHSFKFAAALQAAQGGDAPALIRIDTKAGHGAGKPTTKVIEEVADRWAFLVKVLR